MTYYVHKASGKTYTMTKQPDQYSGGERYALTNGIAGAPKSWTNWVGLSNHDFDPVIDFGAGTDFNRITTHFLHHKSSWIYPPRSIEVLVSDDGQNFRSVAQKVIDAESLKGSGIETVVLETPGARGQFLKVVAQTFGVIPAGNPGGGNGAWLFLDEILVD